MHINRADRPRLVAGGVDRYRKSGLINVGNLSAEERVLAALFVLSFAFDFKGTAGGTVIQFVMAGANALCFVMLIIRARFTLPKRGYAGVAPWLWLAFLCFGSLGAAIAAAPLAHFVRVIYPFILFAQGSYVGWLVARTLEGRRFIVGVMESTALISLVFTVAWGFYFSGDTLHSIRYQILSPAIPFLLAASFFDALFGKNRKWRGLGILAVIMLIVGLSVTRGVAGVAVALFCVAIYLWGVDVVRRGVKLPRPIGLGVFGAGLAIALTGLFGSVMAPEVAGRWVQRVTGSGDGVTVLTRAAAVVAQWHQVTADTASLIIGRGFGHSYEYAPVFYPLISPHMPLSVFKMPMWYGAEFMWIAPIFDGGLVGGALAIGVLGWGIGIAIRRLNYLFRERAWQLVETRPEWVSALAFLAFLIDGFTSNPFNKRLSALLMGLSMGLLVRKSVLSSRRAARTG